MRPGYELWRPNRVKAASVTTKWLTVLLLLLTAGLAALITIGGWSVLEGGNGMGFVCAIYAILYYAAPNVDVPRFRWLTPGAVFGVLVTIVASAAFFFYVSNFSSYSATYGAFAGAVILLIWLWLANVVLLFGAELNAVIDLRRSPELPAGYDGPPLPAKEPVDA